MKIKLLQLLFLAVFLFICVFQVTSCRTPSQKAPPFVQENWETISNRWNSVPFEKIERTAEHGDATAQYYIAALYSSGHEVAKDQVESFKWMKLAAQQGMTMAQRRLGWMSQSGLGVATNLDEAVEWYRKAAKQGDAQAEMNLGCMYENGVSVPQDYGEAAKFYRQAAEQGHTMAQNNLGWFYKNGLGVPDDQQEAVRWFLKSAEQGEHRAQVNLAWIYAMGAYGATNTFGQGAEAQVHSGGVAHNHELAEKWMRQAVDLNTAEGQYQFADLLHEEVDNEGHQDSASFPAAGEWFRKSAEQGYDKAQYQLAEMYNAGVLGNDQRSNCIPWYIKAASQGNTDAQAQIGKLYVNYPNSELLKSIDVVETIRQAAEHGNLDAQFQLAKRYQTGDGVPKDATEAFNWMEKASQHDRTTSSIVCDATYRLAVMYEKGEGVTQNITNAWQLYQEAAMVNHTFSADAAFRVAQMYENGEGVPQDDYQAAVLYYGAAVQLGGGEHKYESIENLFRLYSAGRALTKNNQNPEDYTDRELKDKTELIKYMEGLIKTPRAQFYVGEIYYHGKIIPQDLVEAAAWLKLSANQNLDEARKMLNQIEVEMTPAQNDAAKKRFDDLEQHLRYTT